MSLLLNALGKKARLEQRAASPATTAEKESVQKLAKELSEN